MADRDLGYGTDDQIIFDNDQKKSSLNPFLAGGPSNDITTVNTVYNQQQNSPVHIKPRLFSQEMMTTQNSNTNIMYRKQTPNSAEFAKQRG
jgi:hypothetical protein